MSTCIDCRDYHERCRFQYPFRPVYDVCMEFKPFSSAAARKTSAAIVEADLPVPAGVTAGEGGEYRLNRGPLSDADSLGGFKAPRINKDIGIALERNRQLNSALSKACAVIATLTDMPPCESHNYQCSEGHCNGDGEDHATCWEWYLLDANE